MAIVRDAFPVFSSVVSGEVSGSVTAKQLPDIECERVVIRPADNNANPVYIGGAGVTVPDGTTDTTSGIPLTEGIGDSLELYVDNLNRLYLIGTAATDDILYLAYQ